MEGFASILPYVDLFGTMVMFYLVLDAQKKMVAATMPVLQAVITQQFNSNNDRWSSLITILRETEAERLTATIELIKLMDAERGKVISEIIEALRDFDNDQPDIVLARG